MEEIEGETATERRKRIKTLKAGGDKLSFATKKVNPPRVAFCSIMQQPDAKPRYRISCKRKVVSSSAALDCIFSCGEVGPALARDFERRPLRRDWHMGWQHKRDLPRHIK